MWSTPNLSIPPWQGTSLRNANLEDLEFAGSAGAQVARPTNKCRFLYCLARTPTALELSSTCIWEIDSCLVDRLTRALKSCKPMRAESWYLGWTLMTVSRSMHLRQLRDQSQKGVMDCCAQRVALLLLLRSRLSPLSSVWGFPSTN